MISFHPEKYDDKKPWQYWKDWKIHPSTSVKSVAEAISRYVWSPIIWEGGHRKEKNFRRADYLVMDFDTPEMTLEEAVNTFSDTIHVIGTTRNHQKEKNGIPACDRFRVAIKFEAPVKDIYTYRHNLSKACDHYPADPQCVDGARFLFPCTRIISMSEEGYKADIYPLPKPLNTYLEDERKKEEAYKKAFELRAKYGTPPPWVIFSLKEEIPKGQRNKKIYQISKDLFKSGFSMEEVTPMIFGANFEGGLDEELKRSIRPTINSAYKASQSDFQASPASHKGPEHE